MTQGICALLCLLCSLPLHTPSTFELQYQVDRGSEVDAMWNAQSVYSTAVHLVVNQMVRCLAIVLVIMQLQHVHADNQSGDVATEAV